MRRFLGISFAIAVALTFGATRAAAQPCTAANAGPFSIDGCVTGNETTGSNSRVVGNAPAVPDVNGSAKELGPINASATKLGVIDNAAPTMLGLTNPNASVDLNTVYTQTGVDAGTGHIWYYFGWVRDSNNGSGVISIELQKGKVPTACTGAGGYGASNCNPWTNRADGDIIIVWDQQGGGTQIGIRTYNGATQKFSATVPLDQATARATYSDDLFRGELAIDFSAVVFPANGECTSFANTIPGTVTGNSDTADYKDVVLAPFAPVSNCGSVKVTKVTSPAGLAGSFGYRLSSTGGDIFGATIDPQCAQPANNAECTATLTTPTAGTATDTITSLLPKANYTLEEQTVDASFTLTSIICRVDNVDYDAKAGVLFPVKATKETVCTITNTLNKVDPTASTEQAVKAWIFDAIKLEGIKAGAPDAAGAKVTFRLYSDDACTTLVDTKADIGLVYTNGGTTASASTLGTSGFQVLLNTTYYWRVSYTGDAYNNGLTTACGVEKGTVTFSIQ